MTQKAYCFIAGILFTLVALAHLWRLVGGWEISASGTVVPFWVSWIALVITGTLGFYGLVLGARK